MTNTFCGYILKVHDLERCRAFYRDMLQLGQPVTDSNFRTEFSLGEDKRLILCKAPAGDLPDGGRSAIWFEPDDPALLLDMLASGGYTPFAEAQDFLAPDVKCFQDPEGNLIYLSLAQKK